MSKKYINEEGRAFMCCSDETKDALREAHKKGWKLYLLCSCGWELIIREPGWRNGNAYRAKIPLKKKLRPCDLAGFYIDNKKVRLSVVGFEDTSVATVGIHGLCFVEMDDMRGDEDITFSKDPQKPLDQWQTIEELEAELNE